MSSTSFSFLNHDIFEDINNGEIDPWISSDYHLFKELRKDLIDEQQRKLRQKDTLEVFELHNSKVKPNDVILFLGDLTEEEYGEDEYASVRNIIKSRSKLLNGKKYILKGNNDKFDDKFYKDCGFIRVYNEDYIETDEFLFSHIPVKVPKDMTKLNIHGHIHGSRSYWGVDCKNKIDVYWRLWNGPIKLSQLVKEFENYTKEVKTEKGLWPCFIEY